MYHTNCGDGCAVSGLSGRVAIARPARRGERRPYGVVAPTPPDAYGRTFYRAPGLSEAAASDTRGPASESPIPWGTIIGVGVDVGRQIFGGSDATACLNQEGPELVSARLDGATAAQRAELVAALRGTNPSWFPPGSTFDQLYGLADQLAFGVAGGSDCKVGTAAGTRLVTAYNAMRPRAYPSTGTMSPPVLSAGPGWPSGTNVPPVYDPGPTLPGTLPTTPDAGPSIWEQIKDAAASAGRAAAEAAARAAAQSVQQVPYVRTQIEDMERERRGDFLSASMPLLIGGGLLVGALLLSGGRGRR